MKFTLRKPKVAAPPLPQRKVKAILIDPPWKYADSNANGKRGAVFKYPCMNLHELMRMPIHKIADDDCALFMWVTSPMLPDAFQLIRAWEFKYKTVAFVWIKLNKKANTPFFGLGHWTRSNAEFVLLATKGQPQKQSSSVRQLVFSKIQAHSEKPNKVRRRIVKLLGDVPRIEIFARHKVFGWDSWGNEVGKLTVRE